MYYFNLEDKLLNYTKFASNSEIGHFIFNFKLNH